MILSGFVPFCPVLYLFCPGLKGFCSQAFMYGNFHPLRYLYDALQFMLIVQTSDFVPKAGT